MAGKIDFTVSANADKALSDLAKVINKQDKMIDQLKEQNRQAKKTGKSFGEAGKPLSKMVRDVGGIAAGFISAQAAIGGFKAIVGQLKTEMDYFINKSQRAGQGQFGFAQATTEAVRTTFGTPNLDKNIGSFYSALPSNMSPSELAPQIIAYKGAFPQGTPEQFRGALSSNAGPVSAAGREQQIGLAGQIQNFNRGYSSGDAASVASMLINQTGSLSGSLPAAFQGMFQLSEAGGDPEQLLSRITTGARKKVKPRGFTSMASTLSMLQKSASVYTRKPGGGPVSGINQIYSDIQDAGGDTDINALMGFLDQLPDDRWKYVQSNQVIRPMFGPDVVSSGRSDIRAAISGNLSATEAGQISGSGYGGYARAVETGNADVQRMMMDNSAGLTGSISTLVQDAISNMPGRSKLGTEIGETILNTRLALGADPAEAAISYLGRLENLYGPTRIGISPGVGALYGTDQGPTPNPNADPAMIATLQSLQVTIEKMAESFETINQNKAIGGGMD